MILDIGPIATGKTHDLVIKSAETDYTIVCSRNHIEFIERIAHNLGIEIPTPISYAQFMSAQQKVLSKEWLIDSLSLFLEYVTRGERIHTITVSDDAFDIRRYRDNFYDKFKRGEI